MGLIAAELERRGIATVCLQLLREIAVRVRPPRSLLVPFEHGFPLGAPGDVVGQLAVIEGALKLMEGGEKGLHRTPQISTFGEDLPP